MNPNNIDYMYSEQESRFKRLLISDIDIAHPTEKEQAIYQETLKSYRDFKNIVETAKQEGIDQEKARFTKRQSLLILRLLKRITGDTVQHSQPRIQQLSLEQLERLTEAVFDFSTIADLNHWLDRNS